MNKSAWTTHRLPEAMWLSLAAGLPLFIAPWGRNSFELPKAVLLWTAAAALGAAWLCSGGRRVSNTARDWLPALAAVAYGAAVLLSTSSSVDPLSSALGANERLQGAITVLSGIAVFLLVAAQLRGPDQARRLLAAVARGSAPVAAYGLLQAAGVDPLAWRAEGSPVVSTLGRSNFVGAYLAMAIPATLAGFMLVEDRRWKLARGLLIAGQLACLAATGARAAWLGAAAAFAVLAACLLWSSRRRLGAAIVATVILGLASAAAAVAFLPDLSGSLGARALIWRTAVPLVLERPLLGYGPETFAQTFATVYPPQLVYLQGRGVLVDRAHNLLIDTMATTGLLGLLAGAILVGAVIFGGARLIAASPDRQTRVLLAAGMGMLAGHLVETQFGFGVTATAALFWLALALLASAPAWAAGSRTAPAAETQVAAARGTGGRAVGLARALLAILLVAVVPAVGVRLLVADRLAATADESAAAANLPAAVRDLERAVALWPTQPAYRETLSWYHLRLAPAGHQADAHFRAAESALIDAASLAPGDYRLHAALGELYTEWGRAGDAARFAQAEAAYGRAVAMFPGSALLHTGWGLCYAAQGRTVEAARQFTLASGLDQTDARAFAYLGDALVLLGDLRGAEQAYRSALLWDPGLPGPRAALANIRAGPAQSVTAGSGVID